RLRPQAVSDAGSGIRRRQLTRMAPAMGTELSLDISHTAVVALDCQTGIVSIYAKPEEEFLERASSVLQAARAAEMTVIHVRAVQYPEPAAVSAQHGLVGGIRPSPLPRALSGGAWGALPPPRGPQPADIVVTKHRVNAFVGTDLEVVLRANDIDTLVLFGIAT